LELDTSLCLKRLYAVQPGEKIDVPEFAPELAVRNAVQTHCLLLGDHFLDRSVLDSLQLFRADFSSGMACARLFEFCGPKQAADMGGPERWNGSQHNLTIMTQFPSA